MMQVQSFEPVTKYEPQVSNATQVTTSIEENLNDRYFVIQKVYVTLFHSFQSFFLLSFNSFYSFFALFITRTYSFLPFLIPFILILHFSYVT